MNKLILLVFVPFITFSGNNSTVLEHDFAFSMSKKLTRDEIVSVKGYIDWDGRLGKSVLYDFHSSQKKFSLGRLSKTIIIPGKSPEGIYYDLSKCKGKNVIVTGVLAATTDKKTPYIYNLQSILKLESDKNNVECLNLYE